MKLLIFLYKSLIIIITFFSSTTAFAQNFSKNKKYDTTITSNLIDIKQKTQTINFVKNVIIRNGPDIMTAQKATLFYKENKITGKNEIKNITAYDDVKIFTSNFVATSEVGYYNPSKSLFTLKKDVIVNNGNSIGVGDKFVYNLNTKKGAFISAKKNKLKSKTDQRVTITIDTKSKKEQNKK